MNFNGANVAEVVTVSAIGDRVRFTRNVANIVIDLVSAEGLDFHALGGADSITINDLSGTDLTEINLDLNAAGKVGDGQSDTIVLNGTSGDDVLVVFGDAGGASVLGLAAQVNIIGAQAAQDTLVINALAGDDVVEASALAVGSIRLVADGGLTLGVQP